VGDRAKKERKEGRQAGRQAGRNTEFRTGKQREGQNAHGMVLPIVPGRLLQYELSPWLHQKSIHYSLQPD
jgi:hypothetical protein